MCLGGGSGRQVEREEEGDGRREGSKDGIVVGGWRLRVCACVCAPK